MMNVSITGYEQYVIYKDGRVYSNKTNKFLLLKMYGVSKRLYYKVTLYDSLGNRMNKFVHRLVAESFIPNPDNKPVVNHKDNNPKNNDVSNLEWVTYSENSIHGYSINGHSIHRYKETDRKRANKKVLQVDKDSGLILQEFNSVGEASLYIGIHYTNISKVLSGKQKTAGGFLWKTVKDLEVVI